MNHKINISAFLIAMIFGLGLGLSGMTEPAKVKGFLDLSSDWNPSLAFVMVGAIAVHAVSYRFIIKRKHPLLAYGFKIPTRKDLDIKLFTGAFLFGDGWGLAGLCPGPAIVSLVTLKWKIMVFVAAMICGMILFQFFETLFLNGGKKSAKMK